MYAAVETAMDETDWMGCWPNTDTVDCGQQALDLIREKAWRRPIKDSEKNGSMMFLGIGMNQGFCRCIDDELVSLAAKSRLSIPCRTRRLFNGQIR